MKSSNYIEEKIKEHVQNLSGSHSFKEVLDYALFPAGKLFRPSLAYAIASDLKEDHSNIEYFASSLEIHHSYTLIHDDLPSMDDDNTRRGKASTHKKYGQWKAILAGDALLGMSYGLLSSIKHKELPELLALYHKFTGVEGLILGQVLDLNNEVKSIEDIIRIHTLKTARLIQLSLMGSNILCSKKVDSSDIEKLGLSIGIIFQLIDDLSELAEEIGEHEKEINPFLKFDSQVLIKRINLEMSLMYKILNLHELKEVKNICDTYLLKMEKQISKGLKSIQSHIKDFKVDSIHFQKSL